MKLPKFSIVVPVYKTEQYLEKCVESILAQSFTDFELILVDDGSPDQSGYICDQFKETDIRIKVIHKQNGGVSSARNCGIDLANGEYIWFVDSDDYIEPFSLELLNEICKSECADIYFFNTPDEYNSFSGKLDEFLDRYYFSYIVGFAPWNKLYKASVIRDNGLYFDTDETIGEDLLFNIEYYKAIFQEGKGKASFIHRDYYVYVDREGSAMNTASKNRLVQQMRLFDKIEFLLRDSITSSNMTYLFWLHLIAGINQARAGDMRSSEYHRKVDLSKYQRWISGFNEIKDDFFKNEKASRLGRMRIVLFQLLLKRKHYKLAGFCMGLK